MLSFLKQLGIDIVKGAAGLAGLLPLFQKVVPAGVAAVVTTASTDLSEIAGIIVSIEAAGATLTPNMTGAQKLAAVTPLVLQAIYKSDLLNGKEIADLTVVTAGAEQIASGVVNILNGLKAQPSSAPVSPTSNPTPSTTGS